MKICKKCGAQMTDDKKFCSVCGTKMDMPQQNAQQNNTRSGSKAYGFMGEDHTAEFDPNDIAANKVYGILAVFGILFFIPLVATKESKYGRYWANQGLLILLASVACSIVVRLLSFIFSLFGIIPIAGVIFGIIGGLIGFVIGVIPLVLFIFGLVAACQGQAKDIPVIGKIRIIK